MVLDTAVRDILVSQVLRCERNIVSCSCCVRDTLASWMLKYERDFKLLYRRDSLSDAAVRETLVS